MTNTPTREIGISFISHDYATHPGVVSYLEIDMKQKYTREFLTGLLTGICEALDKSSTGLIERTVRGNKLSMPFTISAVYVCGSYAKGASECGDLDLVFTAREEKYSLDLSLKNSDIQKHCYPKTKAINIFRGTPDDSTSGVVFDRSFKVWSNDGMDWRSAISSIKVDPNYQRTQRPCERMPIDMHRVGSYPMFAEVIEGLCEAGMLAWEFISVDARTAFLAPRGGIFLNSTGRLKDISLHFVTNAEKASLPIMEKAALGITKVTGEKFKFTKISPGQQGLLGKEKTWIPFHYRDLENVLPMLLDYRQVGVVPSILGREQNGVWMFKRASGFDKTQFTTLVKSKFSELLKEAEEHGC